MAPESPTSTDIALQSVVSSAGWCQKQPLSYLYILSSWITQHVAKLLLFLERNHNINHLFLGSFMETTDIFANAKHRLTCFKVHSVPHLPMAYCYDTRIALVLH